MADRRPYRRLIQALLALTALCCGAAALAAHLENLGPGGEFFYDPDTGLYWIDPAAFVGTTRVSADYVDVYAPDWSWATSAQIDGLLGRTSQPGTPLIEVMGPQQLLIGGYRWLGFHAEIIPDGWLAQTINSPDYDTITDTGLQNGAGSLNPGAWFVSTINPLTATRLENIGESGEYFVDHTTSFYWYDPAYFVGMTREDVETWLAAHPDWRWATLPEVIGLLCRLTVGDLPLEDVIGPRQYTAGSNQPRWIGYYAKPTQPDGILIQGGYGPPFHMATLGSTQSNASAWNPGAWIVSKYDPTPVEVRTWSNVKKLFE
ncbi:MAG: hypothetical protein RBT60_13520 [Candidatus Krumholzibacteria bacterium]|nr:hypothetical protein [Candidatus Krumholzibacteria bacterium]